MREFLSLCGMMKKNGEILQVHPGENFRSVMKSTIFEDNNGALGLETSPKITPRTKQISVKYNFFRDKIGEYKEVVVKHVESEYQLKECLTKEFPEEKFSKIRNLLMGW